MGNKFIETGMRYESTCNYVPSKVRSKQPGNTNNMSVCKCFREWNIYIYIFTANVTGIFKNALRKKTERRNDINDSSKHADFVVDAT